MLSPQMHRLTHPLDPDQHAPFNARQHPEKYIGRGRSMTSVSGKVDPVVRRIKVADIAEALGLGLRDFQAMPLFGLLFGALYAAGGIAIMLSLTAFGLVFRAPRLA